MARPYHLALTHNHLIYHHPKYQLFQVDLPCILNEQNVKPTKNLLKQLYKLLYKKVDLEMHHQEQRSIRHYLDLR